MNKRVLFNSESNELSMEYLYTVENYITFNIYVKSGLFTGASNFCLPKDKVRLLIDELSNMYEKLQGSSKIEDSDSDAFIAIEMNKLGHIILYGQIGGSYEDHSMRFKYTADQTVLVNLTQLLKGVL